MTQDKTKGLVIKSTGKHCTVLSDIGDTLECSLKGKFRIKGIRTTNPLAVGDRVIIDPESSVITGIETRKNSIIRRSSNLSHHSQIIASNVDRAYLIVTVNYPQTLPGFIDRFLVSAEAYKIPTTIIFNKIDLYNEKDVKQLEELLWTYEDAGYETMQVSAEKGINVSELREKMAGKINVLSGHSGVGKSTLINGLQPGLEIRTNAISEHHLQGKHTTTFAEMHPMDNGGYIIDTPGIRGFGVIDIPKEEIYHHFPEIFRVSEECKFHNCVHINEPKCAVKAAVEEGIVPYSRYLSYVSLVEGDDSKYRL